MHHAQLLIGTRMWALSSVPTEVQVESADVRHLVFDRMSIADARTLIRDAQYKPVIGKTKIFFISCVNFPTETQNALLKLFEEPEAHVQLYFVIPHESLLLPTLRSRFNLLDTEVIHNESLVFKTFKKLSIVDRLNEITTRIENNDTEWMRMLLHGCEEAMRTEGKIQSLASVLSAHHYINGPGSSKKMILEHIALLI